MVFWLRSAPDAALRLGVVTSRKVGGAAVRVRARRRVREAWRRCRPFFKGDFDVVIVARRSITDASWLELVKEMLWLAGRLKLLDGSRDEVLNKVLDITP
jgi:ribonuclease P protein component